MSSTNRIRDALRDAPMSRDALAEELDLTVRAVGQALAHLARTNVAYQSLDGLWRLTSQCSPPESRDLATIVAPDPIELVDDATPADDRADFAIWQDGSMMITRGDASMHLTRDEVATMAAHVSRFMRP